MTPERAKELRRVVQAGAHCHIVKGGQTTGQTHVTFTIRAEAALDELVAAASQSPPPKGEAVAFALLCDIDGGSPEIGNLLPAARAQELHDAAAKLNGMIARKMFSVVPLFTHPTPSVPQVSVTSGWQPMKTAPKTGPVRECFLCVPIYQWSDSLPTDATAPEERT